VVRITHTEIRRPERTFWADGHRSEVGALPEIFRIPFIQTMHSSKFNSRTKTVLHQDLIDELREAFTLFDTDGKGSIDAREFRSATRALGFDIKKEQIVKMMDDLGKNRTETLSFEEFVSAMADKMQSKGSREDIMRIFTLFDDENQGKISFRNLKRVAMEIGENISDDDLRDMIAEADRDGDGALNFEEFYRVMKRRNADPLDCWDTSDED
jgi:Ca2+-binding EF-hand superfamily protein